MTKTTAMHILAFCERRLGLLESPELRSTLRMKRMLTAVLFRPNAFDQWAATNLLPETQSATQSTAQTTNVTQNPKHISSLKRIAWIMRRITINAISDIAQPWVRAYQILLYRPYRQARRQTSIWLDRMVRWMQTHAPIEPASQQLLSNPFLKWPLLCLAAVLFIITAQTALPLVGQWVFIAVCYTFAVIFKRLPSRFANLCLMALTMLLLARYAFWRLTSSLDLNSGIELTLGYLLVAAEAYTWVVLILGFVQTAWPLQRKPVALPSNFSDWPTVDVFIPTYNEPISVVKPTLYAAKGLDWPVDKITVYLLDDGHRPAFAELARQIGVEYISRPDNRHAKAGNINHALQHTHADYVAIFDCDHIPCRSFLQTTMGWFAKDPQCALVQTPHHFFSADPFERNFDNFRKMPNEGALFYGLIQDGNDSWNASFFCGSCAVIARKPLLEVGGIATETVTEDAHTALKLHAKGYNSVYLKVPQAAGLATETLAGHIGQRIRWSRGMAQIFRLDNPLFKKGLNAFQRICYANAMLHFFYGIPRVIFLTMPLAYLFFEFHLINAAAVTILSYALPQLIVASYTNSVIQGQHRRSFWSEVYETVLSWYIVLPTTLAFINPRLGKFNVTSKGGLIEKSYFDAKIATPYLILLGLNTLGFLVGLVRLFVTNSFEAGTVLMNLLWCLFNLAVLGAAVGVATEATQKHQHHRVRMTIPAFLRLPGGHTVHCYTHAYSAGGLVLVVPPEIKLRPYSQIQVGLYRGDRAFLFNAQWVLDAEGQPEARFINLSPREEAELIQCTFGRADAWLNWQESTERDRALGGLKDVALKGLLGYVRLFTWLKENLRTGVQHALGQKPQPQPWNTRNTNLTD